MGVEEAFAKFKASRSIQEVRKPKILLWDVETAKMVLRMRTYSLKQYSNFLNPMDIERDIWMVCAAWKWYGEPVVASTSVLKDAERFKNNYADDYHVVKTLWDLMDEADILVAHNGDAFDWKIFTSRCIANHLPPPNKPVMVDTLKIARREFKFSSNQLRYLAKFLGVTDKDDAPKWDLVAEGNEEEIGYCEKYCRQDIRTLDAIYTRLLPYITNHPHVGHRGLCPKCRHFDIQSAKTRYLKSGKSYKQMRCNPKGGCGSYFKESDAFR